MLRKKEFFMAFCISTAVFFVPALFDLASLKGNDVSSLYPAWFYFGLSGLSSSYMMRNVIECFYLLGLPLVCSLAYSYCVFDEYTFGVANSLLTRAQRKQYYLSGAAMTFLGAFFVIFVPMVMSQLTFAIAVPLTSFRSTATNPLVDDSFFEFEYFKSLAINSPYLYQLLYCFIPSFVGGLVALMSFSFSLVYHRNRFLVLTLPEIIWLISSFVFPLLGHPQWVMGYLVAPPLGLAHMKLAYLVAAVLTFFVFDTSLIAYKILCKKDEV